jgi:hypothetical protein
MYWLPYIDAVRTYEKQVSRVRLHEADHVENTASSIVVKAYLQHHCVSLEVLISVEMRLQSRCVYAVPNCSGAIICIYTHGYEELYTPPRSPTDCE